jgi:hypothetical protein
MLATTSDDPEVLAAAFEHERIGNFVTVLINVGDKKKSVALEGDHLPNMLDAHVTTATRILGSTGTPMQRASIELPARSLTTLISGSYLDQPPRGSRERPQRASPPPADGAARSLP